MLYHLAVISMIHILAVLSPGPDFFLVMQKSLFQGKKAGLLCSLGISLGLLTHIIYINVIIAFLTNVSEIFLTLLKGLGGIYLIYLGISILFNKKQMTQHEDASYKGKNLIFTGFLCNIFNPKAPPYLMALLTSITTSKTGIATISIYGTWLVILQFLCFSILTLILSRAFISSFLKTKQNVISTLLACIMIFFGLELMVNWLVNF
ncbi:MAG: LysE family translocator [Ostreibacterium sp.]